ncbi:MAG: hypothetical protein ABSF52_04860 [Syntrophobacteraceae bacterium]|jgi:hypothetical protein
MPAINVDGLTFQFPAEWKASKYDDWSFYRNQFQSVCGGAKAIDVLALSPERCAWLIEVKDYRVNPRTKPTELPVEVACKVRDTLAALLCARVNANDSGEKDFAGQALKSKSLGVVLHLEQPAKHSILFPRAIDPATVKQKLKQLLKAVDAHPSVLEMRQMRGVPWAVV